MKKFIEIITIISIIVISLFVIQFTLFKIFAKDKNYIQKGHPIFKRENFNIEKALKMTEFNEPKGLKYKNKKNIIIFGWAVGGDIKKGDFIEDTLSDMVKRPVYNRAVHGGFIQHAILQVTSGKMDDIIKNSDTAVYIFSCVTDTNRLNVYPGDLFDLYYVLKECLYPHFITDKNNNLVLYNSKFPMIEGSILYRLSKKILSTIAFNSNLNKPNQYIKLTENIKKHLIKLSEELKSKNPDTRLIVIDYYDANDKLPKDFVSDLKSHNVEFYFLRDLMTEEEYDKFSTQPEYMQPTSNNPNAKMWQFTLPKIIKKINIK